MPQYLSITTMEKRLAGKAADEERVKHHES
jgi:hypothetical protein